MKVVKNDMPIELKLQAQHELVALQKTSQWKETMNLEDFFTDENGNLFIITSKPKMTLSDYVRSLGDDNALDINAITRLISKLCVAVSRLHRKSIIHRNICQEAIAVKLSKTNPSKPKTVKNNDNQGDGETASL